MERNKYTEIPKSFEIFAVTLKRTQALLRKERLSNFEMEGRRRGIERKKECHGLKVNVAGAQVQRYSLTEKHNLTIRGA